MYTMKNIFISDNESKLSAVNAIEALIDRNDITTKEGVLEVMGEYKAVLELQLNELKGEQYEADANADHVTEQIPNA